MGSFGASDRTRSSNRADADVAPMTAMASAPATIQMASLAPSTSASPAIAGPPKYPRLNACASAACAGIIS